MDPVSICLLCFLGYSVVLSVFTNGKEEYRYRQENTDSHWGNRCTISRFESPGLFFRIAKILNTTRYANSRRITFDNQKGNRHVFSVPAFYALVECTINNSVFKISVRPDQAKNIVQVFIVSHTDMNILDSFMANMEEEVKSH